MIKLIAFDWNGTLLDDSKIAWRADNFILQKLNRKPVTLNKFRESFDVPIIQYWLNLGLSKNFLKDNLEKIEKYFMIYYERHENKARLRQGSRDCLDWLESQKITSIIYSNHITPHIHKQLVRLKIKKYIQKILARELGDIAHLHERGKGQKLYDYLKEQKLKPHEVISVGDTEEEVEVGKARGFHTVAITGGYNTTARLKKHHPDFLIHNMLELKQIIKRLNS